MKDAKTLVLLVLCGALTAFCAAAAGAVTVVLTPAADTDIREAAPTYAKSNRDVFLIKSFSGDSAKAYLRFTLPGDIDTVVSAEFRIVRSSAGAWNYTYDVFGLKDEATGNDWPELSPGEIPGQPYTSGLTWENAPANDPNLMGGFTEDATASLGSFVSVGTNNGGSAGGTFSMSSAALADFLDADSDRKVTLLIGREGVSSSADLFATKENSSYDPPRLVITYEPLETRTVVLEVVADTDVRQIVPDYCKSDREMLIAKNNTGDGIKAYMRFRLPDDVVRVLDATFKITRSNVGAWNFVYNLHGLRDGAAGNDWPELSPGSIPGEPYTAGLTWNNAPANDTTSPYEFTGDATGVLGTFQVVGYNHGGTVGGTYTINTAELASFLRSDTDKAVTLMLARPGVSSSADFFAAKEDPNLDPPQLEITYVPRCGVRLLGDLNWDCQSNLLDFACLARDWLKTDPATFGPYTDITVDGKVDIADLFKLAEGWLACSDPCDASCEAYWQPDQLAVERWNTWRKSWDTFPIAAWSYFMRYDGTVAEYQTYAGAGLTMVQAPLDQFDNAVAAGLRPLIGSWENLYADKDKLEQYVHYPTATSNEVAGYMLKDEPSDPCLLAQLGEATAYIYYYDQRGAIPIVNLLANYGGWSNPNFATYDDYVDSYVATVAPAVLSYDHYAILSDGTDRTTFYENMELMRDRALQAGIGFMGFALVNGHWSYREPSESDLNWQVWSLIAYGAQGIWYYNYRIEPTGGFGEGLVTHADGTPRVTYYMAQAINDELQAMGPVLLGLRTTGVYHTGTPVPSGTSGYSNGSIDFVADFAGDNFLLGEFVNQDDAGDTADYLMVMNKRHSASTTSAEEAAAATLTPNPGTLNVYKFNTGTQSWDLLGGGAPYTLNIGGGQAVLLKLTSN